MTTQFPEIFDPATQEGNSWDLLPVGEYVAQIVEASIQQPKSGDGYYLALTWKIIEGDFEGRQVWQRITYLHSSEQAQTIGRKTLKDLCVALDVNEQVTTPRFSCSSRRASGSGSRRTSKDFTRTKTRCRRILPLETKPAEPEQPAKPAAKAGQAARGNGSAETGSRSRRPRSVACATL